VIRVTKSSVFIAGVTGLILASGVLADGPAQPRIAPLGELAALDESQGTSVGSSTYDDAPLRYAHKMNNTAPVASDTHNPLTTG
jgi:hypothetical protein